MRGRFFVFVLLLGSASLPKSVLGGEELSSNDPERFEKTIERFRSRQVLKNNRMVRAYLREILGSPDTYDRRLFDEMWVNARDHHKRWTDEMEIVNWFVLAMDTKCRKESFASDPCRAAQPFEDDALRLNAFLSALPPPKSLVMMPKQTQVERNTSSVPALQAAKNEVLVVHQLPASGGMVRMSSDAQDRRKEDERWVKAVIGIMFVLVGYSVFVTWLFLRQPPRVIQTCRDCTMRRKGARLARNTPHHPPVLPNFGTEATQVNGTISSR